MNEKQIDLLNEIGNCNAAIKAFSIGCKWLAPDGLSEAPSIAWLKMQKNLCVGQFNQMRAV